ncbi:hypothetical protein [Halotia branconii]|uniref:Uncharacterized protein n=1 Tax=Halotia branconii CENA392 TaxID=1539056 RepID=A0AAJ6PAM9_9CYAN|nr:hypothetical protein [Halotia branconii]WGV27044.1 hypothetical protein QI031_05990 [Halotia branconii CENA392]
MFLKSKQLTKLSNSSPSKEVGLNDVDFSSSNMIRLKGILSYFSYLNINGEISDEAFEALVRYACSVFIENELEERVQFALEQKVMSFWESKFIYALEKYMARK